MPEFVDSASDAGVVAAAARWVANACSQKPVEVRIVDGSDCFAGTDGRIHVGRALLGELRDASREFALYLHENLRLQISGPIGAATDPTKAFTPEEYCERALQLYSSAWLPGATGLHGAAKSAAQHLLEGVQYAKSATPQEDGSLPGLSLSMPKPCLDLRMFWRGSQYRDPASETYREALASRLFEDAVQFVIAHEWGHVALGHLGVTPESDVRSRDDERDADEWAAAALRSRGQAWFRSLLMFFGFVARFEGTTSESSTHPLGAERMLGLCRTLLRTGSDAQLRRDIDVGLELLSRPIGTIVTNVVWPDGAKERVEIQAFSHADTRYRVGVSFYLERAPRMGMQHAGREAHVLFGSRALSITIRVHDRDAHTELCDPRTVVFRLATAPISQEYVTGDGTVLSVERVLIALPPDLWFPDRDVVATLSDLSIADETEDVAPSVVVFLSSALSEHDIRRALTRYNDRLLTQLDRENLVLASERLLDSGAMEAGLALLSWLSQTHPEVIEPGLARRHAEALVARGQPRDAVVVAETALARAPIYPPGLHLVLARVAHAKSDERTACEHAFLEWFGVGEFGDAVEAAQQLVVELLKSPSDPAIVAVREYFAYSMKAVDLGEHPQALPWLRGALECIRMARALWPDSLALRQLELETRVTTARLTKFSFDECMGELRKLVDRAPKFAPPHIQLAQLHHARGDLEAFERHRSEALRLAPFSEQAFRLRDLVRPPNNKLRRTRAYDRVLDWLQRRSMRRTWHAYVFRMLLSVYRFLFVRRRG